jgi:hypothetical protein
MENLPSVEVLNEFERLLESMEYWSYIFHEDLKQLEITHSLGKSYHSLQKDFEIHHKTLAERLKVEMQYNLLRLGNANDINSKFYINSIIGFHMRVETLYQTFIDSGLTFSFTCNFYHVFSLSDFERQRPAVKRLLFDATFFVSNFNDDGSRIDIVFEPSKTNIERLKFVCDLLDVYRDIFFDNLLDFKILFYNLTYPFRSNEKSQDVNDTDVLLPLQRTIEFPVYCYFLGKLGIENEIELNESRKSKDLYGKYCAIKNAELQKEDHYKVKSVCKDLTTYRLEFEKNNYFELKSDRQKIKNVMNHLIKDFPEYSSQIEILINPFILR